METPSLVATDIWSSNPADLDNWQNVVAVADLSPAITATDSSGNRDETYIAAWNSFRQTWKNFQVLPVAAAAAQGWSNSGGCTSNRICPNRDSDDSTWDSDYVEERLVGAGSQHWLVLVAAYSDNHTCCLASGYLAYLGCLAYPGCLAYLGWSVYPWLPGIPWLLGKPCPLLKYPLICGICPASITDCLIIPAAPYWP